MESELGFAAYFLIWDDESKIVSFYLGTLSDNQERDGKLAQ